MIINESTFYDFNEYATNMLKWNLEVHQLSRGKFFGKIRQIFLPNIVIQKFDTNKSLTFRGHAPTGYYNFSLGVKTYGKAIWRGKLLNEDEIAAYPLNSELEGVCPENFITIEIAIFKPFLDGIAERLNICDLEKKLQGDRLYKCNENELLKFKFYLERTIKLTDHELIELSCKVEENIALKLLHFLKPYNSLRKDMFSTKQSKAIGQIEEIINENDFENISIIGLCKKASVSLRTLEYAVQQKFDMTPIQYIRTVRLNKVRKNLQNKRLNGNLITDIANKFGFWHMGQFAKDYKNLFGELPSETLIVG